MFCLPVSKMLSIVKCLKFCPKDSINKYSYILNHKINFNYKTLQSKRCLSSKSKSLITRRTDHLIIKNLEKRCLSSNPLKTDMKDETSSTASKPRPMPAKTPPKPIGIVGFDAEDMKSVEEWITVYRFPHVVFARIFCRLKLYQTLIACTTVPLSFMSYELGLVKIEICYFYSFCSVFALLMMYIFGNLFRRFVGIVYISNDGSLVRLSHLTFFGNRMDDEIDVCDIVPLKDTNFGLDDYFCRIERYSTSEMLFMSLKFGGIVNRDGFQQIFGPIPIK